MKRKKIVKLVQFAGGIWGYPHQKKEYDQVKKIHGEAYARKWARSKFGRP